MESLYLVVYKFVEFLSLDKTKSKSNTKNVTNKIDTYREIYRSSNTFSPLVCKFSNIAWIILNKTFCVC